MSDSTIKNDMHINQPFVYLKLLSGTLANSEDQDEMTQNAAFHQGLHSLL